jgi:pimeloyl-ACP methyl ester carboxylesterase
VVEFLHILPLLTTPWKDSDFVFEVVAPSIPGYGWSSAAARQGLNIPQCARIFRTLMVERLGFNDFYLQGGDWGAAITTTLATKWPQR